MTCGSNSNVGSVAKAMKDALEAKGYSELNNYQRETIEADLSERDFLCLLQPKLARV